MGLLFKIPGFVVMIIGGLWGLVICFDIVQDVFGSAIAFLSLLFFPALMGIAPIYAILSNGDWFPIIINYGSTALGGALIAIGLKLDGD